METWFSEMLKRYAQKEQLTQVQLAERLGVSVPNLNRWWNGGLPRIGRQPDIIKMLGGDLERAMPGWTPSPRELEEAEEQYIRREHENTLVFCGSVCAGDGVTVMRDVEESGRTVTVREALKDNTLWPLGIGAPFVLEVDGESMEPRYYDGDWVILRQPSSANLVYSGIEVVLRDRKSGECSLKKMSLERDKTGRVTRVIGVPLNEDYDPISWPANKVDVVGVVVGSIHRKKG